MANKKNKKKVQQEEQKTSKAASNSKVQAKQAAAKKKASKAKKDAKPGFFARVKKYFGSVRSEMKRVTWPSKKELINLSLVVCASLIVVGVAIALFDTVISEGLVLFSGLRG